MGKERPIVEMLASLSRAERKPPKKAAGRAGSQPTKLRNRTMKALFDTPRRGWVALLCERTPKTGEPMQCVPVRFIHVPQREFQYADYIVYRVGPDLTAWGRKHVASQGWLAHYGRWGLYRSTIQDHVLFVAQDHKTLLEAVVEENGR